MLRTHTIEHLNIFCGACKPDVETIIRGTGLKIAGEIDTNVLEKKTTVQVEIDEKDDHSKEIIEAALREGGRLDEDEQSSLMQAPEAVERDPSSKERSQDDTSTLPVKSSKKPPRWLHMLLAKKMPPWLTWLLGGIGVTGGIAMLALMLSGIGIPFVIMAALGIASALVSLALGSRSIYQAINSLKNGAVNMDTLYALGGLTAIGITIAHLFVPGIPMLFDAALFIFGFKYIGDGIKERATRPAKDTNFRERAKISAVIEPSGEIIELDKIAVGSVIRVPRGSIIPIDGILLDDEACVFKTLINGKTTPKVYGKDKVTLAGLRIADDNPNEYVRIKTIRTAQDSYLSQLDKRLAQEKSQTPEIISVSDRILRWFIPTIIAVAVIAAIVMTACFFPPLGFVGALAIGLKCLVAVLVSACPCTMGLVVPLAAKAGIDKAERHDVIFKDDKKLQTAAQVNTIIFDLNGTLTTGKPVVKSFFATKNYEQTLAYATAIESRSYHAFAKAIREFGTTKKTREYAVTGQPTHDRTGISGTIDGKRISVGNANMMENLKLDVASYHAKNKVTKEDIQQLVYAVEDGEIVGHFVLEDPIRLGAKQSVNKLKSMGYEIHMCTGADDMTANAYAATLGIEHVYARCKNVARPSDGVGVRTKSDYIRKLQAEGKIVAMIGDGGNDAIPMMTSHLGIGMKSSSSDEITLNLAGAVIDSPSLLPVVALLEAANQTVDKIKTSLITSLSLNTLTVAAAIVGTALTALGFVFPPAIGAGLMVLLIIPVLVNVARLGKQALPHYEEVTTQAENEMGSSAELMKAFGPVNERDLCWVPAFAGTMRVDRTTRVDGTMGIHEEHQVIPLRDQSLGVFEVTKQPDQTDSNPGNFDQHRSQVPVKHQ